MAVDSLKNKVAVVTGASSGIGESLSYALARNGVDLYLLGRDESRLQRIAAQLREIHPEIHVYTCDLASADNICSVAKRIINSVTGIDILVHSAGSFLMKRLDETTEEEFDSLFSVNTRAPFILTRLLLPLLEKNKGQIVFLNSSASQQKSRAGLGVYTASKYALQAITDSLREEVNASEVRVLSIYPGRTATAMQEEIFRMENRQYEKEQLLQPEDIAESIINALSLPRTAEITDIFIRPFKKTLPIKGGIA